MLKLLSHQEFKSEHINTTKMTDESWDDNLFFPLAI
jgi:hypothetical protein